MISTEDKKWESWWIPAVVSDTGEEVFTFPTAWIRPAYKYQFLQRIKNWQTTATGKSYRKVVAIQEQPFGYRAEPLPNDYVPLSEFNPTELEASSRNLILSGVAKALQQLHHAEFYMGFLLPGRIFVHRNSYDIVLDVQPFPSAFPIVNGLFSEVPGSLFSKYARYYKLSQAADFYAFGILMYWLWTAHVPELPIRADSFDDVELPSNLQRLCRRLLWQPESVVDINAVLEALHIRYDPQTIGDKGATLPNPPATPTTDSQADLLQTFFYTSDIHTLAVLGQNETARMDVVRMNINNVIERNFFITVSCKHYPLSTMQEAIDRIASNAALYQPETKLKLKALRQSLDVIVRRHYDGNDVISALSNWLKEFCDVALQALKFQRLYIAFEHCEDWDMDSQRVLFAFWNQNRHLIPLCQIMLSGERLPSLMSEGDDVAVVYVGNPVPNLYERLIRSQCPGLRSESVQMLSDWMLEKSCAPYYVPLLLEDLTQSGVLLKTPAGWVCKSDGLSASMNDLERFIEDRLSRLTPRLYRFLAILAFLPSPVRIEDLYLANQLDTKPLGEALHTLVELDLIRMYHSNSVYVPREVWSVLEAQMPEQDRIAAAEEALALQSGYRPDSFPPLIELARLANQPRLQYYLMIRYYRQVRTIVSDEPKRELLLAIDVQRQILHRVQFRCWRRWLSEAYYQNNQVTEAAELMRQQEQAFREPRDTIRSMLYRMFTNSIDVEFAQRELAGYVLSTVYSLNDRAHASMILLRSDAYRPLDAQHQAMFKEFYEQTVFIERHRLSTSLFAELTVTYAIFIFQYFPKEQEFADVLLQMIQSILFTQSQSTLMSSVYDAYMFHTNMTVSRSALAKQLAMAQKTGSAIREQLCHLNGMELSLYQGDVGSFLSHQRHVHQVGEIRRKDLIEQYWLHLVHYACEWGQGDLFNEARQALIDQGTNGSTDAALHLFEQYASYQFGLPAQSPEPLHGMPHYHSFVSGLHHARKGNHTEACDAFDQSIAANPYYVTAGWSYREWIRILLLEHSPSVPQRLKQFETYLKDYAYDVFWPDFYYLTANWHLQNDDVQRALLYLRRAVNGYQMIGKTHWYTIAERQMQDLMEPLGIHAEHPFRQDPLLRKLIQERKDYLTQSLDLLVILDMSQVVTESLDITLSIRRLVDALFEYFPVGQIHVNVRLHHRDEELSFSSAGHTSGPDGEHKGQGYWMEYDLYNQGGQSITIALQAQNQWSPSVRGHLLSFLSAIKPHIANATHYLEMMTDNLTGFYQRRYFVDKLEAEYQLAKQYNLDLSVVMLDIDNFRTVNSHGHPEGDRVLRELSKVIGSTLRDMDIPVRFGGEEFLFILPKTDGHIALRIANQIRERVEEWFSAQQRSYHVTVSMGVASLQLNRPTAPDDLVSMADSAEILAKTRGKNQVIAAWNELF